MNGIRLPDENVGMVLAKSGFISEGFSHSSEDYSKALNEHRPSSVKGSVKHEQRVYVDPKFGAQRKLLSTFVLIPKRRTQEKKCGSGKCFC